MSASRMGPRGLSWSYICLPSVMFLAWKVICRQQLPIPKAIESMCMKLSGAAPLRTSSSSGH